MKTASKALLGTIAAGAMAVTSASPAMANDRNRDRGVDAGDIIAGAVILGGIAAIATAGKRDGYRDNYRYDDRRAYRGDRYQGRGNSRAAIQQCVRAAERDARRSGYRGANVTDIRQVKDTRYGWRVKGEIAVQGQRGYDNRVNYNRRGQRGYKGGYDTGRFTCDIQRGRVVDLDYRGIRGLR
ncbi:hypothetical protein OAS19_05005 [Altererythrobacter sp.]|nr:hypothetical protein [Altererythrobacter sp.]